MLTCIDDSLGLPQTEQSFMTHPDPDSALIFHITIITSSNTKITFYSKQILTMCGSHPVSEPSRPGADLEPFPWHIGVFDAHNHIAERAYSIEALPRMKAKAVAIMATRTQDQSIVEKIAASHGAKSRQCLAGDSNTVIAGYGRHPWFSHELYDDSSPEPTFTLSHDIEAAKEKHYKAVLSPPPRNPAFWGDLPTPIALSDFIAGTKARLEADPIAMVGEVGLDKIFRLPMHWDAENIAVKDSDPGRTRGGRQRRPLSPHNVCMSHQKVVLLAHLKLAGELGRAASVHGVQAHGTLYDVLTSTWKGHELRGRRAREKLAKQIPTETPTSKPFPPRICLHSFKGKSDAVKQYLKPSIPAAIFFSFCKAHNLTSEAARATTRDAVREVPDNRVLVESDLHVAGDRMDDELEEMYREICDIKGWTLEDGVARIADNYREFIFGIE